MRVPSTLEAPLKGIPYGPRGSLCSCCLAYSGTIARFRQCSIGTNQSPTYIFFRDCLGQFRTPAPLAYLSARYLFLIHELGYIRRGKGSVCVFPPFSPWYNRISTADKDPSSGPKKERKGKENPNPRTLPPPMSTSLASMVTHPST